MSETALLSPPSRLRVAAFSPIGEEGRTELVESRIVQAISVGAFTEGERLPSETELSALLGVAVVTVREALGTLRHRGLIETRRGRNGGSFVRPSHGAVEEVNARALMDLPRVSLADLGVHYEVVSAACAEYACQRATPEELEIVAEILDESRGLERAPWRRRITEVQLELAALSQSVRLTNEHVRVQTEFTPFLALQDLDREARLGTHDALVAQLEATRAGDVSRARAAVREGVRASVRWLVAFRAELLADPRPEHLRGTLEARSRDE
ncbi:FadR/GntR family transcriptional regulator [Leucobacter chromiireducens]|uniref:FadR family transcriptional regulator n=1 Tax=Leucobacter chromiireducens subsp. solipictus TaxID=398235 RepID=A0ABS1SHA3_9MICO|nr:GntR family transcriptional regulator [Leucobacter chromiireducens]MBL3679702.1 FadR family transcriptional regulator [Leucobacter chromiireducens subsp. solipictus]